MGEREQLIEAMARAYYEWATMNEGETSRWDEHGNHQSFARARAEVMLDAALSVRRQEPCPDCEGREDLRFHHASDVLIVTNECTTCWGSGVVDGEVPAIVAMLCEWVATREPNTVQPISWAFYDWSYGGRDQYAARVFVLRPSVDEEETE